MSVVFVGKLLRRQRHTGSVAALPGRGGWAHYLGAAAQTWRVTRVEQMPDQTLAELRAAWVAAGGRPVCLPVLWCVLDAHGLRRKKCLYANERDSERARTLRQQHVEAIAARADVGRFHFLDETGLRLGYTRRYD